jgi:hypothetical protein
MSEQYAFAIGFDRELEESGDGLDEGWTDRLAEVAAAIAAAGLPPIDSERWDEFGQGRVFWGTKAECESVRRVLSQFDLYTEEDRNLDPGYYATVNHTYYVDAEGEIYVLPDWSAPDRDPADPVFLENICAIPLDAYRLKVVEPEIDDRVQAILRRSAPQPEPIEPPSSAEAPFFEELENVSLTKPVLEEPISEQPVSEDLLSMTPNLENLLPEPLPNSIPQSQPVAVVPADIHTELQTHSVQQAAQIEELEHRLRTVLIQVDELQSAASAQVDPRVHERLKLQCNQQTQRTETLQTQLQSAAEQFAVVQQQFAQQSDQVLEAEQAIAQAQLQAREWQSKAEQAVSLEAHEKVQQQSNAQAIQIRELQQFIQRLEQQLKEATAQAEQKVETSRYEALEQDVADKAVLIKELRRTIQQHERDLREWQTVAEAKVDWSEHQALREELQRLQSRKKRGLFSRLFGWLWN